MRYIQPFCDCLQNCMQIKKIKKRKDNEKKTKKINRSSILFFKWKNIPKEKKKQKEKYCMTYLPL